MDNQESESEYAESSLYYDSRDDSLSYKPHPSRFEEYELINDKEFKLDNG